MSQEAFLREAFAGVEVNADFTEAVVHMRDGSRIRFRHRVGERWAVAAGRDGGDGADSLAGRVLAAIAMFRLNGKHLDVRLADGGRWEARFRDAGPP